MLLGLPEEIFDGVVGCAFAEEAGDFAAVDLGSFSMAIFCMGRCNDECGKKRDGRRKEEEQKGRREGI